MSAAKKKIADLLAQCGVQVNGSNPWDLQVHDERLFRRLLSKGSIGAGESYMDGWWSVPDLAEFFTRIIRGNLPEKIKFNLPTLWLVFQSTFLNMQTKNRARKVAKEHYNIGNDLYMSFLDPYNQYTCGYWKTAQNINEAQEDKLDLICKKLDLSEEDKVLDIGCGWGGFAKFASERYGCHVTGVSISEEQIKYAKEFCKGLPVDIVKSDYRDIKGKYDKVLICGMIEHVGYRNYRTIMQKVHNLLTDQGLFLLHTIGSRVSQKNTDAWLAKYIFPNSMIPSSNQLSKAAERLFVMEDWHNFGYYYYKTLIAWNKRFKENWSSIKHKYDDRFYKMFEYYLLGSAGYFNARIGQLWQIVYSKHGVKGGYGSVR